MNNLTFNFSWQWASSCVCAKLLSISHWKSRSFETKSETFGVPCHAYISIATPPTIPGKRCWNFFSQTGFTHQLEFVYILLVHLKSESITSGKRHVCTNSSRDCRALHTGQDAKHAVVMDAMHKKHCTSPPPATANTRQQVWRYTVCRLSTKRSTLSKSCCPTDNREQQHKVILTMLNRQGNTARCSAHPLQTPDIRTRAWWQAKMFLGGGGGRDISPWNIQRHKADQPHYTQVFPVTERPARLFLSVWTQTLTWTWRR